MPLIDPPTKAAASPATPPSRTSLTPIRMAIAALSVSGAALVGLAVSEGYSGRAYNDTGGVPTLGFGETKGVVAGQTTDPVRALIVLSKSVDGYAAGVKKCVSVPLYQYEFDAYVDVAYNVGVSGFCNSEIAKRANAQDYAGACAAIVGDTFTTTPDGKKVPNPSWRIHDRQGHLLQGLKNRRTKEYNVCIGLGG